MPYASRRTHRAAATVFAVVLTWPLLAASAPAAATDQPPTHASPSNDGTANRSRSAPYQHYVTDTMRFGSTVEEAKGYGLDLDPTNPIPIDNSLGKLFAGFKSILDFDAPVAESLTTGDAVVLHSLRTHSGHGDRSASWHVYPGVPQPDPVLTGGGTFEVDRSAPAGSALRGSMIDGHFAGGPGQVTLRLGLVTDQPPIEIHLVGARIEADCSQVGCQNAKLGGGISVVEVQSLIIPAMAAQMQVVVGASCTVSTPDLCSHQANLLLSLFDANGDFMITADEVRGNNTFRAILTPDVDLLKANGRPGHDGIQESVSLGLGFTASNAIFRALARH